MKATRLLHAIGQSTWLDNISRELLQSGTLKNYCAEYSITGLTTNPSIYENAIGNTKAYDEAIAQKFAEGKSGEALFFELALEDLTQAASLFSTEHEASSGIDGWVSLEVSPLLASDTLATIEEAKHLHALANCPNLFIKVPGNAAGIPAIEELIFAGVPINVTLLFSREQYVVAADAYWRGIQRRIDAGLDPRVGSVASIFVSRWDQAALENNPGLVNSRLGIAMAGRIYKTCCERLASTGWRKLADAGAMPQRLLWASTGTKDPNMRDTYYVESLAAPDTINTMPEKTLLAFADHGQVLSLLQDDGAAAEFILAGFAHAGMSGEAMAAKLQREGTESFIKSWRNLLAVIESKRASSPGLAASLIRARTGAPSSHTYRPHVTSTHT